MNASNSLNYLFLKRFINLLHIFIPFSRLSLNVYNHNERIYFHPLFIILLLLINEIGLQFVIYFVGLLPSKFYDELTKTPDKRDIPSFRWLTVYSLLLVGLNACLKSLSTFLSSVLYVKWRIRFILYLHSLYFTQQRYYHLSNTTQQVETTQSTYTDDNDQESADLTSTNNTETLTTKISLIDNPDQRITQDVDSLCRSLSNVIPILLISPFTIAYYTYRTWQITGYYGPLSIIIYFLVWSTINKIFVSYVSRTIYEQNKYEGSFRFLHTQIRTYNEPIAFYNGGLFEHKRFDNYFLQILTPILYRRTIQEFFLSLSTNLFDYIGSILSYLLLALVIFIFHFYKNVSPSELVKIISQTSFITMYLIYRFSQLNDLTDKLTIIAANTHRVQAFVEYMKNLNTTWLDNNENKMHPTNEILIINNLSYSAPNNRKHILMKNLNLTLTKGQRLLITGDSGVGKTSLLRVLYAIWPVNMNGSYSFNRSNTFLLPQRPYFTDQSLFDELSYPDVQTLATIEHQRQIERVLSDWNLSHILSYVESSIFASPKHAWQDLLSPGELQRLSFVRLVLRISSYENDDRSRLNLIFLDEITSSLDIKTEMKMYNYLIAQNLAFISIGHRETLRKYHEIELNLDTNGKYIIKNLESIN